MELWQLRGEEIQPGDQLTIPGLSAAAMIPPTLYTVESGDSWYDIADMFSVTFLDLLLDNFELWAERGINIEAGDELKITFLPTELTRGAIFLGAKTLHLQWPHFPQPGIMAADRSSLSGRIRQRRSPVPQAHTLCSLETRGSRSPPRPAST